MIDTIKKVTEPLESNDEGKTPEPHDGVLQPHVPGEIPTKGDSYMEGFDTTAFSNLGTNAVQFGARATGAGVLTVELAKSFTNGDIQAMAADMAADAVGRITGECGALIGQYVGKATSLVASIPGKIANATARRISSPDTKHNEEPIRSVAYYLVQKTTIREDLNKAEEEVREAVRKSDRIKNAQEKISDAVKTANKFIEKANERIAYVQKYALEGPQWVADQMDKTINDVITEVDKQLEEHYNKLEMDVDTYCDKEGTQIGAKVVQQTNRLMEKLATEIKNKNEETITQAKIKAKSTLQKAKLAIMGLLGVNIHIPISTD